jgi:hypothetical protein
MSDDHTKTVRITRSSRVAPDDRGRNVWVGKVETVELELVSTTALEKILKTGDGKTQVEIRELAKSLKDGVLARDTATGHYQIVSDEELKSVAQDAGVPKAGGGDKPKRASEVTAAPLTESARLAAAELSLVSTQILRKVVKDEAIDGAVKVAGKKDEGGGFNPYDNG